MKTLREVQEVMVILELSSVMENYTMGVDIAKGEDVTVVTDWAILDDGEMKAIKQQVS